MDSLDAQCLLIQLTADEIRPPDLWRHDRSGALTCGYEGGQRTFTWPAEDVAEMARRWRHSDAKRAPEQALAFRDAHERLASLASGAGLGPADVLIHDLARAELRGVWEDEKVVLVVEGIVKAALATMNLSATPAEAPRCSMTAYPTPRAHDSQRPRPAKRPKPRASDSI
jgi:hypothetical protein